MLVIAIQAGNFFIGTRYYISGIAHGSIRPSPIEAKPRSISTATKLLEIFRKINRILNIPKIVAPIVIILAVVKRSASFPAIVHTIIHIRISILIIHDPKTEFTFKNSIITGIFVLIWPVDTI